MGKKDKRSSDFGAKKQGARSASFSSRSSSKPSEFSGKKRRDNPNFKRQDEGGYSFSPPSKRERSTGFDSSRGRSDSFESRDNRQSQSTRGRFSSQGAKPSPAFGKSTRFNVEHNMSGDNPRNFTPRDSGFRSSSSTSPSFSARDTNNFRSSRETQSSQREYSRNSSFESRSRDAPKNSYGGVRARAVEKSGRAANSRFESFDSYKMSSDVKEDVRFDKQTLRGRDERSARNTRTSHESRDRENRKDFSSSRQTFAPKREDVSEDVAESKSPSKSQSHSYSQPQTRSFSSKVEPSRLQGVFTFRKDLCTFGLVEGSVYGERIVDGYRIWDPKRSKLGAGLYKGISQTGIKPGSTVLYLGCSTGTTVSHVSDIIGLSGKVYGLDVAPRVMRDFLLSMASRENVYPIMADAAHPQDYAHLVETVDVVFMDIAQRDQVSIFLKNCHAFLKPGGFGLLSLKSRSIDITKSPKQIFMETRAALEKEMTIVDYKELAPYEIDHALFVCKKK
jgi:fibrillarin-like pre-rRNA processing protein